MDALIKKLNSYKLQSTLETCYGKRKAIQVLLNVILKIQTFYNNTEFLVIIVFIWFRGRVTKVCEMLLEHLDVYVFIF